MRALFRTPRQASLIASELGRGFLLQLRSTDVVPITACVQLHSGAMVDVLHHQTDHISANRPSNERVHARPRTASSRAHIAIHCTRFSEISSARQQRKLATMARTPLPMMVAIITTSSSNTEGVASTQSYETYTTPACTLSRLLAEPREPGQ
jgi:hypothetical protein